MKKSAFLLVISDSPSDHLAIIALTLLEALHRELNTRDPSVRRDLILLAGPSPSSPWGLQGPVLPHAQQQGPTLPPASSFEDLRRGSDWRQETGEEGSTSSGKEDPKQHHKKV